MKTKEWSPFPTETTPPNEQFAAHSTLEFGWGDVIITEAAYQAYRLQEFTSARLTRPRTEGSWPRPLIDITMAGPYEGRTYPVSEMPITKVTSTARGLHLLVSLEAPEKITAELSENYERQRAIIEEHNNAPLAVSYAQMHEQAVKDLPYAAADRYVASASRAVGMAYDRYVTAVEGHRAARGSRRLAGLAGAFLLATVGINELAHSGIIDIAPLSATVIASGLVLARLNSHFEFLHDNEHNMRRHETVQQLITDDLTKHFSAQYFTRQVESLDRRYKYGV